MEDISENEKKIRKITQLYYSRLDIQKEIFEFSKNREISSRYFEGFGKRPDSFNFKGDVFALVKKGATSFHCSEELWEDPMKISTGMDETEANEIRIGWDLVIDIDCEQGIEFSKYAAQAIVETFKQHGIENVGIKFSGSKGFHIILPWKAFPKTVGGLNSKDLFPELPRKIIAYVRNYSQKIMRSILPFGFEERLKDKTKMKHGYMCEKCGEFAEEYRFVEFRCDRCGVFETRKMKMGTTGKLPICYKCKKEMDYKPLKRFLYCPRCDLNSIQFPENFGEKKIEDLYDLMGLDLVLVSPRHLFRMPYSLHEKTALVSVVIDKNKIDEFNKERDADPLRIKIKKFMPEPEDDEAKELVMQALDWAKSSGFDKETKKNASGKYADFKPINLKQITEEQFPPCVRKILKGMQDGKKRGLFILINLFRSIGMEKEEFEKRIYDWNKKNEVPLKKGYIHSQLSWTYKRKPLLPPNCRKFYQELGICSPDKTCSRIKNPINYVVKKNFAENNRNNKKDDKTKSNFKK